MRSDLMDRFSIVDFGGHMKDIQYLVRELRSKNLIISVEKDVGGDTVYLTNNLVAVKKVVSEYEGLMLDVHRT